MCGFVGFTGYLENQKEIINKMSNRIVHRGPDMSNEFVSNDGLVSLGFRRLSILDVRTEGNQPMSTEDGRYTMVFNGEIYNFKELRSTLENKGYTFKTGTDSEVLLKGYAEYKEKIVPMLRGMFAFVIYDVGEKKLFGARDYFGIKPFYYSLLGGNRMLFGSEIKSFLEYPEFDKKLNENALRPYLTFQYPAIEETFFKNVFKLTPANYFTFDLENGEFKTERYWHVDYTSRDLSYEDFVDGVERILKDSVAKHTVADVKVGAFLSGGVDSSYVVASMMPDETFSVGFDYNKFDETNYAGELSKMLGIKNYRRMLTADECMDKLSDIQYHMDEPDSNPSCIPLFFLSELASQHVTVVLSGEGADETYAGYEAYEDTPGMKKYKRAIPQPLRLAIANLSEKLPYFKGHDFLIKSSGVPENYFIGHANVYNEKEAYNILNENYRNGPTPKEICKPFYDQVKDKDELTKKLFLDLNVWMIGDILLKADKMSMAHSLELRVPFLDKFVYEDAMSIPSKYKIDKETKQVFRDAANRILPEEWATRPKKGFPVPIKFWFKEDKYANMIGDFFSSDFAKEFFDTNALHTLLKEHREGKMQNQRKIYTALTFLVWYERYFIKEK